MSTQSTGLSDCERHAPSPSTKLLSKKQVLERVPVSFVTLWKLMREGTFPRARQIGGRSFWLESEVDRFIASLPIRAYLGDLAAERKMRRGKKERSDA
jgi:predicted DNA-binding transcriptional regulator AlpA